jgi:hypothetical protein
MIEIFASLRARQLPGCDLDDRRGETDNDTTRPNPAAPAQRVRGEAVYTLVLP